MEIIDFNWAEQLEVVVKVVVATGLGCAIGAERELSNKPAGLRTHALLAAAAALLVGLSDPLVARIAAASSDELLRADPIRVIEAIVTGVAFLGAGTIFRHRGEDIVEGLTTAASLLLVAALAIAVAIGQLLLALIVTIVSLALLRASRWLKPPANRHTD
jgi:putative Mg2+ transporter-C (MgtC) family protein